MSEPKRYTAAGSGVVRTDPKGDLVLYVDYARLLIEVDELKSQPDPLTAYLYAAELAKDDIKRLKAEVERLKEFILKIPDEARIKMVTDAHKGRWDGCPPSDEYIKQMRDASKEEKS